MNSDINDLTNRDSLFGASTALTAQEGMASRRKQTFEDVALLIYQQKKGKRMLTEQEKAEIFRTKIEKLTNISVDEQENMQAYMELQARSAKKAAAQAANEPSQSDSGTRFKSGRHSMVPETRNVL